MKIPKYFSCASSGELLVLNLFENGAGAAVMSPIEDWDWLPEHLFIGEEKQYDGIVVSEDWQEWFVKEFLHLVPYMIGLSSKFSHLNFAGKFGMFV